MVEVDIQLEKYTELEVVYMYLTGSEQGTVRFGNLTTQAVLQYLFNTFGRVNLWDKDLNDERMKNLMNTLHPLIGYLTV